MSRSSSATLLPWPASGLLALAWAFACTGSIDGASQVDRDEAAGADDGEGSPTDDRTPGTGGAPAVACTTPAEVEPTPLVRLDRVQLANTYEDLLGAELARRVTAPLAQLPADELVNGPDDVARDYGGAHLEAFATIAANVATAVKDAATLRGLAGECAAAARPAAACVDGFLRSFGRRAYRRPITDDQRTKLAELYRTAGEGAVGFGAVLRVMLQAPAFLYLVEEGKDARPGGAFALDAWELAARLSYRLWDSLPDAALAQRAEDGSLLEPRVLEAELDRMVEHPRARAKAARFFRYWVRAPRTATPLERAGVTGQALREAAVAEAARFADEIGWKPTATFADLLLSRASFATGPLAALYGHAPAANGPVEGQTPRGALLRGPTLFSPDHDTHPILRGALFRRRYFCDSIIFPVDAASQKPVDVYTDEMIRTKSSRERVSLLTSGGGCRSCHERINAAGFALEGFGPAGERRTREEAFSLTGARLAEHPIDTRATLTDESPNVTVDGAEALIEHLARSPRGLGCFVSQVLDFQRGPAGPAQGACPAGDAVREVAKASGRVRTAFVAPLRSPATLLYRPSR